MEIASGGVGKKITMLALHTAIPLTLTEPSKIANAELANRSTSGTLARTVRIAVAANAQAIIRLCAMDNASLRSLTEPNVSELYAVGLREGAIDVAAYSVPVSMRTRMTTGAQAALASAGGASHFAKARAARQTRTVHRVIVEMEDQRECLYLTLILSLSLCIILVVIMRSKNSRFQDLFISC